MEKKTLQKQTEKIKKITEDLLNMNNGSSKKRKPVVQGEKQIAKKIRLKPDPKLLFSQFKPKDNPFDEKRNVDKFRIMDISSAAKSSADSSKVAAGKVWTPPLKNLLPRMKIINDNNNDRMKVNQNQFFKTDDATKSLKRFDNISDQLKETNIAKKSTETKVGRDYVKLHYDIEDSGNNIDSTQKLAIEKSARSSDMTQQNFSQTLSKDTRTSISCTQSDSTVIDSQNKRNSCGQILDDSVNDKEVCIFEQSQDQFEQYGFGEDKCEPDSLKGNWVNVKSQPKTSNYEIVNNDEPICLTYPTETGFRSEDVPREESDRKAYSQPGEDGKVSKISDISYGHESLGNSPLRDDSSTLSFPFKSEQTPDYSMETIIIHDADSMKQTDKKNVEEISRFGGETMQHKNKEDFTANKNPPTKDLHTFSQETNKECLTSTFIDLTNEPDDPVDSSSMKIKDNIIIKKEIDENVYYPYSSGNIRHTKTVIDENLKSPIVLKIFDEARNGTDVITFLGNDSSKAKDYSLNESHTKINRSIIDSVVPEEETSKLSERPEYSEQDSRNSKHDYQNEVFDQEDEKIMKEIRIFVYSDLMSSKENQVPKDDLLLKDTNENQDPEPDHELVNQLTDSQRSENDLVIVDCEEENAGATYVKQEVICENIDAQDNNEQLSTEENVEECEVEKNDEQFAVEKNERYADNDEQNATEKHYQRNVDNDEQNEDKENYQRNADNDEQNEDKENYQRNADNDEQNGDEENELKKIEDNELTVINNRCDGEEVKSGNDTTEHAIIGDDAFEEDIDMSCTQLFHIENEYSTKKRDNKTAINHGRASNVLQQRNNSLDVSRGVVHVPWVSHEPKKNDVSGFHRPIPWVNRLSEEKQKLRAVIQELVKLNDIIQQARQDIWPSMMKKDKK